VAAAVAGCLPPDAAWRVRGLSYKDASLVARLATRGFPHADVWQPTALGVTDPCAGIETLQQALITAAPELARQAGPADLIVARHILEHAHALNDFFAALGALLKPQGYLLLEVPDVSVALATLDYSTVWEEHRSYFTPDLLRLALAWHGYEILFFKTYPYPLENALVVLARRAAAPRPVLPAAYLPAAQATASRYRDQFAPRRELTRERVRHCRADGQVAIFGAGHLACKFINFNGLDEWIDFVIDDHPHKRGLCMPGSQRPIVGSAALDDPALRLCLTSLNPESESRVREKFSGFTERGGRFASIFPASPQAFLPAARP
ncbi:MAG: methyltransferase domain-containing protein, partial [Candidatus Marinimicrobia bacterium]|nr:methyltransferase domain-containing protein [Candidatus Neomarinimicrobiota bacterium]